MQVELTTISEKGQLVIPSSVRQQMKIKKADKFLVFGEGNVLILKKVEPMELKKRLTELTKPLQDIVEKSGFTRLDLKKVIQNVRAQN